MPRYQFQFEIAAALVAFCLVHSVSRAEPVKLLRTITVTGAASDTHAPLAAFSPSGKQLAVACDNKITLFDSDSGKEQLVIPLGGGTLPEIALAKVEAVGFFPDGKGIFAHMGPIAGFACWDANTGRLLARIPMEFMKSYVSLSPRGDLLAFCINHRPDEGGTAEQFEKPWSRVVLFDTKTGKPMRQANFEDWASSIRFQPGNGDLLALGFRNEFLLLKSSDLSVAKKLTIDLDEAPASDFSPDGRRIAYLDDQIAIREIDSWESLPGFEGTSETRKPYWFSCLSHAPDGKLIAGGGMARSPEGKVVANGGVVVLFDIADNGREAATLRIDGGYGVDEIAFSPDGSKLIATGAGRTEIYVWDVSAVVGEPVAASVATKGKSKAVAPKPAPTKSAESKSTAPGPRTWTSADGKFSVVAEYVEQNEGHVQLKKSNGALITVPKNRLSTDDLNFLEGVAK